MSSDEYVQKFLGAPNTREVREWLAESKKGDNRSLGEQDSTEESVALAKEIYDAGAAEVLAVGIDDVGDGQNTCNLVIKLPRRRSERQRIFAWCGALAESHGLALEPDIGQSYLFVRLE